MKLTVASLIGRADVSYDDACDYDVSDSGALDILDQEGRPVATWACGSWAGVSRNLENGEECAPAIRDYFSSVYVSPRVLGEMNRYVGALVGARD
jgi:hypothetical protein